MSYYYDNNMTRQTFKSSNSFLCYQLALFFNSFSQIITKYKIEYNFSNNPCKNPPQITRSFYIHNIMNITLLFLSFSFLFTYYYTTEFIKCVIKGHGSYLETIISKEEEYLWIPFPNIDRM